MKLVKQLMDELSELGILPSLSWDSSAFMAKVNVYRAIGQNTLFIYRNCWLLREFL